MERECRQQRSHGWRGLWLAVLTASACGQLLGDLELRTETAVLPVTLGPMGVAAATCNPGEVRCGSEGQLQVCVRFQLDAPGDWLDHYACGSPALCLSGATPVCVQAACQAGEASCEGAVPRMCNAHLTGWDDLPACASAAHCSTSPERCGGQAPCCLAAACTPGEQRCNDGALQECGANGADWITRVQCVTGELCRGALESCTADACECPPPACGDGETRCRGAELELCNRERTGWEALSTCETQALCERGQDLVPARCEQPSCSPETRQCVDDELWGCRSDRTALELLATCGSADLCDASAGRCAVCQVGDYDCSGGVLARCLDGTGFVPLGQNADCIGEQQVLCRSGVVVQQNCAAGFSCQGQGECACVPGPPFCDDDDLIVCSGGRFVEADRCQGAAGNLLTTCNDGELRQETCDSSESCQDSSGSRCDNPRRGRGNGD